MANRKRTARRKIPIERYRKVARELHKYAPDLKPLATKKSLTAAEKRKITRIEDKVHKLSAGSQRLVPLTEKQIRQLKSKSFVVPGLNAVIDRNIAKDTRAVVKNGELFIRENGKYLKLIEADATNPENFIDKAASLFKGKRGRFNVWVRFNNGRSNSAFTDEQALLDFIIQIYEKYQPEWEAEGNDIDEFVEGFEVYEQPAGTKIRRGRKAPKPKKRKPHRKKTARKKTKKTSFVKRALKARFAAEKPKKREAKSTGAKRGTAKKNRRH